MAPPSKNRPSADELRSLYEGRGLSAAVIAEQCGVEKITVLRWLSAAGIERRAGGRGLANRGVAAPTADQLQRMLHEECVGYDGVAKRYGVDSSAVLHWCDRLGITRPTIWQTRRRGVTVSEPTEGELRERLGRGESLTAIAEDFDVSATLIRARCSTYGIKVRRDGWQGGKRFPCADGHLARSTYELRVDDWLAEHEIAHEVEPTYPWDRRYRADFRVGDTYIEVWGVIGNPAYQARRAMKVERCRAEGIDLIQINHWQFANGRRWWRPLLRLQDLAGSSSG